MGWGGVVRGRRGGHGHGQRKEGRRETYAWGEFAEKGFVLYRCGRVEEEGEEGGVDCVFGDVDEEEGEHAVDALAGTTNVVLNAHGRAKEASHTKGEPSLSSAADWSPA